MVDSPNVQVQRVQLGLLRSLWAVAFCGVRFTQNRLWKDGRRVYADSPCPCGSGKKFSNCYGRP